MGKRAAREYRIIAAAQNNFEIDLTTLTEDELNLYNEIKQECDERRTQGLPQFMYELPWDAYDD